MLKLLQSRFLPVCFVILTTFTFNLCPAHAQTIAQLTGQDDDPFRRLQDAVVDTGMVRDATPALFKPKYLTVSDASLSMEDNEPVFLAPFFPDGKMRIYPQRIMVWHEVINEFFDDAYEKPVAITYCPITGSLAAYNLHTGKQPLTLGLSGELLNNNSMLYDHFSGSAWPQITGQCIDGAYKGRVLPRLPMMWSTWGRAKAVYSDALVLSRTTGYKRNYGKDPYGSYLQEGNYYDNQNIVYPVLHQDKRLPPKERMHCLEFDGLAVAINKAEVKKEGVVNFTMGLTSLVAAYDPLLDTVRVFGRELSSDNIILTFSWAEDRMVDNETRTEWNNEGKGVEGTYRGQQLTPFIGIESMWFGWVAFYPHTRIVPGPEF